MCGDPQRRRAGTRDDPIMSLKRLFVLVPAEICLDKLSVQHKHDTFSSEGSREETRVACRMIHSEAKCGVQSVDEITFVFSLLTRTGAMKETPTFVSFLSYVCGHDGVLNTRTMMP